MITLHAGDNLQHALDTALPGETIQLEPGATWLGNFTTKNPVTLCGNPTLGGPAPQTPGGLATLRSLNSFPALRLIGNTPTWRFSGLCFAAGTSGSDIVQVGDGIATDPAWLPRDIEFDRCLFQADQTAKNGLQMNAIAVTLRRCAIRGVKLKGQESHAIVTWNSPGPFLIEDCYLEAGSCGLLVGGAKAAIPNLVPADLTFRRNTVTRPLAMRGGGWGVKNLFELKNAKRVVCTGNTFENNWVDAQAGFAIVLTVRANSPDAPWSTIQDVLFESNTVRHSAMGFNLLGLDNQRPHPELPEGPDNLTYPSTPMDRVIIRNNLCYDISSANWGGTSGWAINISGAPKHLSFERNTILQTGNIISVSGLPLEGFRFVDNIALHNTYGIKGDSAATGNGTIARYFPDGVVTGNILAGASNTVALYPFNNYYPTVAATLANFRDAAAGDYRLVTGQQIGCDQDALDAAARVPQPQTLAETITALAQTQLAAAGAIGGNVSPQQAASGAITGLRDALLQALETA